MQISSVQPPLCAGQSTPGACVAASATASSGAPAAPSSPRDAFSLSAPPDPAATRIGQVLFGTGKPTQLDRFLGDEALRIEKFEKLPPSEHAPSGGWTIGYADPPGRGHVRGERFLRNHEAAGRRISGSDELSLPPFGQWTRVQDGWKGECILENPDASAKVRSSMLRTVLHDDGRADQVLWEMHDDGGGVMYRLDGEAFMKDPKSPPAILEVFAYAPGDPVQPPFPMDIEKQAEIPTLDQFLGEGAGPTASFEPVAPDGQFYPQGGWHVDLSGMRSGHSVHLNLRNDRAPGEAHPVDRGERELFGNWVRTQDGWANETESPRLPETFGQIRGSRLRTALGVNGEVAMSLRVDHNDGSCTVYRIDAQAYRRNPDGPPVVLDRKTYARYQDVGDDIPTSGAVSSPPPPSSVSNPNSDHAVRDEGGFIIVDGIKLPKRC